MALAKEDKNIFAGDQYAALSETCLYYIGDIIKHANANMTCTTAFETSVRIQ
jgi:glutamine synthetase